VNIFSLIGTIFNTIFMQPIFNGLMLLYFLFKDYGLSIIVLTVIIKLLLFPLTLKQLKSMKANQQLQPQMLEIRNKYAKDPQAQAQAMQALYKEYGFNPVSGCLPMLVQLPVLYGLYYALSGVLHKPETYTEWLYTFLHPLFSAPPDVNFNWLTWLNPTWHFPLSQSDPSHVLPVIAALATFVQIRMSQPKQAAATANKGKAATPDPSASTMKIMQYVMPAMTLIFALSFPAGMALYWTVSSIFQAVQQYFVTGWGALLTTPDLKPKSGGTTTKGSVVEGSAKVVSSNGSNGTTKKSTRDVDSDEHEDEGETTGNAERSGAVASKLHTTATPRSGGTSSTPRGRSSNSASARRRTSNAQRSRR
jgi:YidC/Oxa1 family membrane protein insertase